MVLVAVRVEAGLVAEVRGLAAKGMVGAALVAAEAEMLEAAVVAMAARLVVGACILGSSLHRPPSRFV